MELKNYRLKCKLTEHLGLYIPGLLLTIFTKVGTISSIHIFDEAVTETEVT